MAKRWVVVLISFLLLFFSCKNNTSVMICKSSTAHAYHIRNCKGLRSCTHEIETITLKEAEDMGRTPCGYCY
jgi:hypothetical protein